MLLEPDAAAEFSRKLRKKGDFLHVRGRVECSGTLKKQYQKLGITPKNSMVRLYSRRSVANTSPCEQSYIPDDLVHVTP